MPWHAALRWMPQQTASTTARKQGITQGTHPRRSRCLWPRPRRTGRSFDPSGLDPKARKAFPLRLSHFLTDITRVQRELAWTPKFDVETGLADSFTNDYAIHPSLEPDFSADRALIGA